MNTSDSVSQPASESTSGENPSAAPVGEGSRSTMSFRIVILGGGEAGLAVLDSLAGTDLISDVVLIEPSTYHYDQPAWMRVGTEGIRKEQTRSLEVVQIPPEVTWVRDRVKVLDPEQQAMTTDTGAEIRYDYLVVALGTEVLWDRIRGLKENLGSDGICSVYGYEQAERTWELIRGFEGGRALFTAPSTPYKGGSAPLTILRQADALWRDTGVRAQTEIFFTTAASDEEFGEIVDRGDEEEHTIHVYTSYDLLEVRPNRGEAVFSVMQGKSRSRDVLRYDLLHAVPPMRPPALIEESGLAYQDGTWRGYLEVDPESYRHIRFDTVFGVGDVLGIEGAKTGERAREQAAVVARTLRRIATAE